MTDRKFTEPPHLPGIPAWLFEYDWEDGAYCIIINGSDPQQIINEYCLEYPGLRLLGEHGGTVSAGGDA